VLHRPAQRADPVSAGHVLEGRCRRVRA
jgi:hypothetical protein